MPPLGMSPAQTQQWATQTQNKLRSKGIDPATYGFNQGGQAPKATAPQAGGGFQAYAPKPAASQPSGGFQAYAPQQGGGYAAYNPSQAQPKQPPSQGSPYGGGIGTLGGPYSDPRWSHSGGTWNSGQQPKAQTGGVAFPQGYTYRPPQRGQQPSAMPPPSGYQPPQTFPTPPGYGQPQPTPGWAQEGYRPDPNGPATGGGFMLPPGLGGPMIDAKDSPPLRSPGVGGKQGTGHPDFVDARQPGMAYAAVMESWYNPQTGERAGFTAGMEPRPGSGWVREGVKPSGDAYGPGPINNAAPPFRSEMKDQFGNPTTPEQFYPQQQAMIGRMYDQFKKMDTGVYLGQGAPPPSWGQAKPLDIPSLWNQAGKDVQAGWRNPYMPGNAQPIQPPSQGMPYNPMQPQGLPPFGIATDPNKPIHSIGAGLGYTERQLNRDEFYERKFRQSRNLDPYVDSYDTYEQYLQSGTMGGQDWLPRPPMPAWRAVPF